MYIKNNYYRISERFVCIHEVRQIINLDFKMNKLKTKYKNIDQSKG